MNKPDPLQHMMLWGASTSGLVLLLYFFLNGTLQGVIDPFFYVILIGGVFMGFLLGSMSAVIIGMVFQHEQVAITTGKIHNRRKVVLITVFLMVLLSSRLLIVMAFGFIQHPLLLSFIGAIIASLASQHYLYRMEKWLTTRKRKRKNDEVPARLLDETEADDLEEYDENRESENSIFRNE